MLQVKVYGHSFIIIKLLRPSSCQWRRQYRRRDDGAILPADY